PNLGIGWIPPLWKQYIQPNVPQWLGNYSFFLVFFLLFPWLMGPMEGDDHKDVEVPKSWRKVLQFLPETVRVPQSVKAERCRFLESANCASVCVNTCKVPSQGWLTADFGMPLHIQPNYDDFSCRWRFGVEAPPLEEDEAVMVPCFTNCPSQFKGTKDALSMRQKLRAEKEAVLGSESHLVVCLSVIVFAITACSYYFWGLLPAWEADAKLGWTKTTTLTVNWSCTLCEALGLCLAGPAADYLEPGHLMAVEGLLALTGVFVAALLPSAAELVLILLFVNFVKGNPKGYMPLAMFGVLLSPSP
ncbi:unnamed protein product, partial [Effrenium voratum]